MIMGRRKNAFIMSTFLLVLDGFMENFKHDFFCEFVKAADGLEAALINQPSRDCDYWATFADRLFFIGEFYFFINLLEDLIKERANSTEV